MHVAKWYELPYGIVDTRALSRYFVLLRYTASRGPWRNWYRHVGIDDKYQGIVSIAQY